MRIIVQALQILRPNSQISIFSTKPDDEAAIDYSGKWVIFHDETIPPTSGEVSNLIAQLNAGPSLQSLKNSALVELNVQSQKIADSLTAGYPEFEKMTWEDQRKEALAWEADSSALTPYIDKLALIRGIDRIDYLQKTLAKTKAFADAAQKLVGQRQKYEDQIKAAQTPEELAMITPIFDIS